MDEKVLHIGSGRRVDYVNSRAFNDKIIHVDRMYTNREDTENVQYSDLDIFEFLETYEYKDITNIYACRVFEHIPSNKIPYLLYLLSEVSEERRPYPKGLSTLNIIVPDFNAVAKRLKNINRHLSAVVFNRDLIDIETELFNEPSDPHRSVWTKELAHYYFELEGFWNIKKIHMNMQLDNRNWYMNILAEKSN